MKLENSNILVIGGAGFIGSFVVKELLKHPVASVRKTAIQVLPPTSEAASVLLENNLLNDQAYVSHPLPQRTFVVDLKSRW